MIFSAGKDSEEEKKKKVKPHQKHHSKMSSDNLTCYSRTLLESLAATEVNFSIHNFILDPSKQDSSFDLSVKIILCLLSIFVSLTGNLYVIYSILIEPYVKKTQKNKKDLKNFSNNNSNCRNDFISNHKETLNRNRIQYCMNKNSLLNNFSIIKQQSCSNEFAEEAKNSRKKLALSIYNSPLDSDLRLSVESAGAGENNTLMASKVEKFIITRIYKPCKNKPVNLFILNLCICDLMIVVWCSWVHLINTISHNWIMGAFFCRFNTYIQVVSLTAAISTLCLISFERYKAIVCTMRKKLNRGQSICMIILIWLFSMTIAMPIFLYRKQYKRTWKDHVEIWCADAWPRVYKTLDGTSCVVGVNEPLKKIYYTFISIVLFFVPIFIMLVCYMLIVRKLSQTKILKYIRENSSEKEMLNRRRQKVNICLIILIVSFAVCWTPVQFFILYEAHRQLSSNQMPAWFNWLYFLGYLLAYSNSAINPFIYSGLNKVYEKELRKIINIFNGNRQINTSSSLKNYLREKSSKKIKNQVERSKKMNSYG